MADDRKSNQGASKQTGGKQAPGRRGSEHGTDDRQGNKGGGQGSGQKGNKQGNR